ncbi:arabinosyltransferase domain-containing protein [Nocardia higoensis]|uniref:arabinosyltransferase domain-containing protein n=1 Tax=Nocardia higoensis TaxID=228599 RepID=UPI0002D4F8C6|nr:arabinosyltransferase domain-containing protein [Nocardia higoensis]
MADTLVRPRTASADDSETPPPHRDSRSAWARPVALLAALIGVVCAIAVPLLPVRVDAATLNWPQNGSAESIEAPLVGYAPLTFEASVPCAAIAQLGPGGGVLVASGPTGSPDLERHGFLARVTAATDEDPSRLDVVLRNQALFSVPVTELAPGCALSVRADVTAATAELTGFDGESTVRLDGDYRPQLVGIYSDLAAADGTVVTAEIDSRFSSTPTPVKRAAIWLALIATAVALVALHFIDREDGRRNRRITPRLRSVTVLDGVVIGVLVLWHFIGATTSDDGYQFGMARASGVSGYMANYFAYFGVPENPIGTPYYDLIRLMSEVTTASPWVRLPALLAGILVWLLLSREVVPRLGVAVRNNRLALWTGALGFLAVWLPYNNGLRPEPPVALGLLLTWVSVERAIATRRLLPAAVAILIAAFTITAGPSGVICIAALVAGIRPVARTMMRRVGDAGSRWRRMLGYATLLAPLGAAGLLVLAISFADQPLSAAVEMQRVHHAIGPDVPWFQEYLRYQYLFQPEIDGSIGRRIGIFMMLAGLVISVAVLLRRGGRIPLTATGPARRLLGTTAAALLLIMITPTKWTHHFGVYAGVAGGVAVLAAMAVSPRVLRAPRNRALFAAAVAFLLALVFSGTNGWWYVSSYGMPWWDKSPSIAGIGLNKVFLALALALLLVTAWWHVRTPDNGVPHRVSRGMWRVSALPPLTIALAALVLWDLGSFAKAAVAQGESFSLARSNIEAVTGNPHALAGYVLVEQDPNEGMLEPLSGDALSTFTGVGEGFTPAGVAEDLRPDAEDNSSGSIADALGADSSDNEEAGRSTAALPFGLDPARVPVMGSYRSGDAGPAELTTGWYRLPAAADRRDIIALSAAGRIRSVDADGVVTYGQQVEIEYGAADSAGDARPLGRVAPIDIGPAPSWRNLRVPFTAIPAEADVIRIVAVDRDRNPAQWLALTPPRMPETVTLDAFVGSDQPVLIDWMVGLQFPNQRPFDHRHGIAEIPAYRILPDRGGAAVTNLWQSHDSGGPLGWTGKLLSTRALATYLDGDWDRDWGELQQLTRIDDSAVPAEPEITRRDHSGLWSPGPINSAY